MASMSAWSESIPMIERSVEIVNQNGIHARPAAEERLVELAVQAQCDPRADRGLDRCRPQLLDIRALGDAHRRHAELDAGQVIAGAELPELHQPLEQRTQIDCAACRAP